MSADTEPVRWGVLSTAHINDKFLAGAQAAHNAEVLAVASRDAERAERYAREHAIARAYGDYGELLADPEVEAVYIPLPNALHVEWTVQALQAGKHVLCEKPIARRADDAERACALAARSELVLSEGFMYRHNPQTARVRELVAAGAIGALRLVRAQFSFHMRNPADVRLSGALEGGALMDVGCYCVNAARLLAGEPVAVSAVQTLGGDGVDVRFAAAMEFQDGVLAHFDAGIDVAFRYELEVVGADAALRVRDPWHCLKPGIEIDDGDGVEHVEVPLEDSYRLEAENVSAAVRSGGEPLIGPSEIVAQARVIEALYAAADGGHSVRLPPDRVG